MPKTAFTFATNSARDRVWVEVWRDNERVAEGQLEVNMEPNALPANVVRPRVQISITEIPRYEPAGGPDTRADIGGKATGELTKDRGSGGTSARSRPPERGDHRERKGHGDHSQ